MKKIYIGYIKNGSDIELATKFIRFVLSKPNKLIRVTDEVTDEKIKNVINNNEPVNCIFSNQSSNHEQIQLIFRKFNLESFYQQVDVFVNDAYDDLALLSDEPYDQENSWKIKDILINNCIIFDHNTPLDLIHFFGKIFFDILTKHKLINGNKRVATMLLCKLCYNYGFFVENSLAKDTSEYWQFNENKIISFAKHYEQTHEFNEVQNEIYDWLINSLYIANNFR